MVGIVGLGLLALMVVIWAAGKFSGGDPKRLAELFRRYSKQAAGAALLAFSAFAAVRGNWMPAVVLMPIGLGLLQISPFSLGGLGGFGRAGGAHSRFSTRYFEVSLDPASGRFDGRVVAGAYAGRNLAEIDPAGLLRLRAEVAADPDSLALIEAYLDRRAPGWREHVDQGAGPRQRGPGLREAMSKEEAYQVLGLQPGASQEAVRSAHRTLMKRFHPDTGGSNWLAAKINSAKDILLGTHG